MFILCWVDVHVYKVKAPFAEHCRHFELFRKHDFSYFWGFVWPFKGNIHLSSFVMPALSLYRTICWICWKGGYLSSSKGTFDTYCQTAQFWDNYCNTASLCRWRLLVFTGNRPVLSPTPKLGALSVCGDGVKGVGHNNIVFRLRKVWGELKMDNKAKSTHACWLTSFQHL